ncbi:hypothetical protein XELAEV_18012350mg [Xenopus laevis]|uniref:Uncharacterized protein n=1 Tax=Xenopus laevis TaxID=8355 RepID=A0A974HYL9_XENLA|nr:hypothetical protein XELAEV_18012350mg [Xenopus laevis]
MLLLLLQLSKGGSSLYPHPVQRLLLSKGEFQQTLGSATSQVNPGISQTTLCPMRVKKTEAKEKLTSSLSVLLITTSKRKFSATSSRASFISRDRQQPNTLLSQNYRYILNQN